GRVFPDLFKCPPWPDLIAEAAACRPVYVHFDLKAGSQALDGVDWEALRALKERTGTPYVNVHLTGLTRFFPHIPHDSEDPRHFDEVAGRMIRDVRLIAEKFGAESVIVEN